MARCSLYKLRASDRSDIHLYCDNCQKPSLSAVKNDREIEALAGDRCKKYLLLTEEQLSKLENKVDRRATQYDLEKLEERVKSLEN